MTVYFMLKYLHVIGACVLLGTGAGIAFFMLLAHLQRDPIVVAAVARIVVIADFIFTATAVIAQPITGVLLARTVGYSLGERWIVWSIVLYILTGAFWLPVVWMQIRMRDLAGEAACRHEPLPHRYAPIFPSVVCIRLSCFWSSTSDFVADDCQTNLIRNRAHRVGSQRDPFTVRDPFGAALPIRARVMSRP
jgi:uncharacterized membrane protein